MLFEPEYADRQSLRYFYKRADWIELDCGFDLIVQLLRTFFSTPSLEFLNVGSVIWERLQLDELLKVEIIGNLLFCIH